MSDGRPALIFHDMVHPGSDTRLPVFNFMCPGCQRLWQHDATSGTRAKCPKCKTTEDLFDLDPDRAITPAVVRAALTRIQPGQPGYPPPSSPAAGAGPSAPMRSHLNNFL